MMNSLTLVYAFLLFAWSTKICYAFYSPQGRLYSSRMIISCSADVEKLGRALYDAAYSGNAEKMRSLLAKSKGDKKVLNWANIERYGRTPLVIASYYGRLEAVNLLLGTPGIDPNSSSDFGATALHFAAHRGHVAVVKALINDRRTKISVKATGGKWEGKTALDVTEGMGMSGNPDIIDALKAKGAK